MQDMEIKEKVKRFSTRLEQGLSRWVGHYVKDRNGTPLSYRELCLTAGRGLLTTTTAAFFAGGEALGGTHPFGLALLCAAGRQGSFALMGLLLPVLAGRSPLFEGLAALLCFLLRYLAGRLLNGKREPLWQEPHPLRMVIATAGGFTVGLYGIVAGGFAKSRLWEALFLIGALPALVYLFLGVTEGHSVSRGRRQAGWLALLYALILAMGQISLLGVSPALTVALVLTLATAISSGPASGCLVGLVSGLACGAARSPLLALCGLAAGALRSQGKLLPLLAAAGVGHAFVGFTEGPWALFTIFPAFLWSTLLYLPAARLGLWQRLPALRLDPAAPEEMVTSGIIGRQREEETRARLTSLSDALSSLSSVFYALSHRLSTPGLYELRELCESCFKASCHHCKRNGICWGQEYDRTADAINKLAAAVGKGIPAEAAALPEDLRQRCPHTETVLSELRLRHARLLEQTARQNKTEVVALDYEAMAKLLETASREHAEDLARDEALTRRVRQVATERGMRWNDLAVYGKRRKTLVAGGNQLAAVKLSAEELRRELSEACGVPFTLPEFRVENRYVTMTAHTAPVLAYESARASLRKEDEPANGDSAVVFQNREDYVYALLSDGMGSGTDAAVTSRIACIFLEKLLAAGNPVRAVLPMLNQVIRHKTPECFATVDLLEIDLLLGEASFIKSGAAASYILREGKLFRLAASTLPVGITREITAEEIRFALLPGDLVVMISDGVSQGLEEGGWLPALLSEGIDPVAPLSRIARRILDEAKEKHARHDDMTVALVRLTEAKAEEPAA